MINALPEYTREVAGRTQVKGVMDSGAHNSVAPRDGATSPSTVFGRQPERAAMDISVRRINQQQK